MLFLVLVPPSVVAVPRPIPDGVVAMITRPVAVLVPALVAAAPLPVILPPSVVAVLLPIRPNAAQAPASGAMESTANSSQERCLLTLFGPALFAAC